MRKLLIVVLSILIFQSCKKSESQILTETVGASNKTLLDTFIFKMESSLVKIYNKETTSLNYEAFLRDVVNDSTEDKFEFDSIDFDLLLGKTISCAAK